LTAFTDAGLRGFWRGYFAGRSAPLGAAGPELVTAIYFNFAPAFVARALPGVWELITPRDALKVRHDGAVTALAGLLAGHEDAVAKAAGLLGAATEDLDCPGRPLAAANTALPLPADDLGRLWQAATLLREHRGDGHFAALTAAGLDGCEIVVLRCADDLTREQLQPIRGWTDDQWQAAADRLAARGWLDPSGALTSAAREGRAGIEAATDRAAARPWLRLGPDRTAELADLLTPLARICASILPFRSPVGVPAPEPPRIG
jgi:hypothetical protein